jgi:hypothetical protein
MRKPENSDIWTGAFGIAGMLAGERMKSLIPEVIANYLGLAVFLFAVIHWLITNFTYKERDQEEKPKRLWAWSALILFVLGLVYFSISWWINGNSSTYEKAENTFLSVQMNGLHGHHTLLKSGNIFSQDMMVSMPTIAANTNGAVVEFPQTGMMGCYLLVVFKKPVRYSDVQIFPNDGSLPTYQINVRNEKCILVVFNKAIEKGIIDVKFTPAEGSE